MRRSIGKLVKAIKASKSQHLESLALGRNNSDGKNPNPRPKIARRPRFR